MDKDYQAVHQEAVTKDYCVFCEIVAHRQPARIRYEDAKLIVFDNQLDWAPVMLLVVPRRHITQREMWTDPIIAKVTAVGVNEGLRHCPNGFRVLANFGPDAMQSQEHAHLHVIGGTYLGRYA